MSNCPAQAVTPVTSSPELTTKSDAMKMTAGSPKPPSAWPSVSTPLAHSANAVSMATTTTGSLFETNRTTATAMMVAVYAIGLNRSVPHLALLGLSNPIDTPTLRRVSLRRDASSQSRIDMGHH